MKAAYYQRYGPPEVLEVGQVPAPEAGAGEALVRVRACGLNPKHVLVRKGRFRVFALGASWPRIPCYDFAGVVEALGPGLRGLEVGQEVYGMIQRWAAGAAAQWVSVPDGELALKPGALSWEEAAAVPLAALTALQALEELLQVGPGQRVLLNGASGGVGTFAVQLTQILGASPVAVCSGRNEALVRRLGAEEVIDYTTTSLEEVGGAYDAVFDIFGNLPYPRARGLLAPGGRYVSTVPRRDMVLREALGRLGLSRARLVVVQSRRSDLERLTGWIEAGRLEPVVDRALGLEEIQEAQRYIETKRARGKVVLRVS